MKKNIKALISDVDGILTDGRIWLSDTGKWRRAFHIQDGLGIKSLLKEGIQFAVISGSNAEDIRERMKALGVSEIHIGVQDKEPVFNEIQKKWGLADHEIAYIGDDIPDQAILKRVGLAFSVPNAMPCILNLPDINITKNEGGCGALREVCDQLIEGK